MKNRLLKSFIFLGSISYTSLSAFGQGSPDAGALQQSLQRQIEPPSALGLPQPSKPEYAPLDLSKSEVKFVVKRFALTGVKLLALEDIEAALKPWLNIEVSFADLQKAMNAIETFYREKGYLAQAQLPPQALEEGIVNVDVFEAKLGVVIIDTDKEGLRFNKSFATDFVTERNQLGAPLRLEDLERSLMILNEVPGIRATSALEAGEQAGETNLRLKLAETSWLVGRAEANNYGSRTTGMWQSSVGATLNNPFGYGDQVSLNGIYSQGSQYTQGSYNFPLGASGLRLNFSGSYLNYTNIGDYAVNGGKGSASVLSAELGYPLLRQQATNLNLSARYDNKSYLNNNLATGTVISQYSINSLTLGMAGNHFDQLLGGGITSASIGLVLGQLSISNNTPASYGSFVDLNSNYSSYLPTSYAKIIFNINRNQTVITDDLYLKLNVVGQFSNVNLNSAEQFYLGGPYGVRAYPSAQAGGSQGAMINIELQKKLPEDFAAIAFFDAGTVQQYRSRYPGWRGATNASNIYSLAGAGVGVKYVSKGLAVAATVAWRIGSNPLYNQSGVAVNTDNTNTNPMAWLTLSYQFGVD